MIVNSAAHGDLCFRRNAK